MDDPKSYAHHSVIQWQQDAAIESLRESGKKEKKDTQSSKRSKLDTEVLKLVDTESLEKLKQLAIDQYNEMEYLIMAINDIQDGIKGKSKS